MKFFNQFFQYLNQDYLHSEFHMLNFIIFSFFYMLYIHLQKVYMHEF